MGVYSKLFRGILFPIMEISQGTKIQSYLKWLNKTQWWRPKELEDLQNKKLRALIKHAYENVPYYHRLFRKLNLKPEDIKTKEDLQKLPLLTKEEIRKNFSDLLAKDFKKWQPKQNATSGSTGEPLKYYTTIDSISMGWAVGYRAWGWAGYKIGDKLVKLGGSSLVPSSLTFKKRLRYCLERVLPLPSTDMTEETLDRYALSISKFKPEYIRGYPSSLFILAKFLAKSDYNIQPKAIFTTAETLLPSHRRFIQDVFNCDVLDGYGCRDGSANAMECVEHSGYHMASELVIMEFIKDGEHVSPGEAGEIVATDLHNYAMPFIRYAVGDVGVPSDEQCSCGRGLPLVKSIEGRVINMIKLKDGTLLSGLPFTDIFEEIEYKKEGSIRKYQIVQENKDLIVVKIVRGENFTDDDMKKIIEFIRDIVKDLEIKIEFVDEIPSTKSGKRLFVVSKVV